MRILAVEDEAEYLDMLKEVMLSLGHSVTLAANGDDALAILNRQPIDVIISDVRMPGMDGLEFHSRVRSLEGYRNTPFVFLTGVDDVSAIRAASNADCDLLLQKPFPVDRLLQLFSGKLRPKP
jgi:two-component system C4-dicarboxylate transport response regulator DctD